MLEDVIASHFQPQGINYKSRSKYILCFIVVSLMLLTFQHRNLKSKHNQEQS